jgi:hypothetical protein
MRLDNFLSENIIEKIKNYLTDEGGYDSWEDFVYSQEIGDCQSISKDIERKFRNFGVKAVIGEIEVDEPYIDLGKKQDKMLHHWVTIRGIPYDFAKGTIKDEISLTKSELLDPKITDIDIYHRGR